MTEGSPGVAPWRPTVAYSRAAGLAAVMLVCALIFRRPDLLVLAAPLALLTAWSVFTRPTSQPAFDDRLGNQTVREGDATIWHGTISGVGNVDLAIADLADAPWTESRPVSGVVTGQPVDGAVTLEMAVRSTRWGLRPVGPLGITAASSWGAFRWSMLTERHRLTTLPLPARFDAHASVHPTDGLIGMHRSARPGEGNEFAGIRPFRAGDRLRRINWARSARTNELQVNSTWADLDMHIALLVDTTEDFGVSEGIDGLASSLDGSVRAAGAIAEHFAPRGERVSLRTFPPTRTCSVPPATGRGQLRRVLDALARVQVAREGQTKYRASATRQGGFIRGQLTVVLSPLIAPEALDLIVSLGRSGETVIVVDTIPDHVAHDEDELTALAWRIRLLERRRELRVVAAAGIPVVAWRGPGSLDQVIRDIARRSTGARLRPR